MAHTKLSVTILPASIQVTDKTGIRLIIQGGVNKVTLVREMVKAYNACRDIPKPEAIPKLVEALLTIERQNGEIPAELTAQIALREAGIE